MPSCTRPVRVNNNGVIHYFPCRRCIACKKTNTLMWTIRLLHELYYWDFKAVFITLTYDDEHLPKDKQLHSSDLCKFWKRLRKNLDNRKIAYFASAEYGDERLRPHFHAIVFGLDINSDSDKLAVINSWRNCQPDQFDLGAYEQVETGSIMYVCGYVEKKLKDEVKYKKLGLNPPFQRQSKGLGYRGVLKNDVLLYQMLTSGSIAFNGLKLPIPKYYYDKMPSLDSVKTQTKRQMLLKRFDDLLKLDPTLTVNDLVKMSLHLGNTDAYYNQLTEKSRALRDETMLQGVTRK